MSAIQKNQLPVTEKQQEFREKIFSFQDAMTSMIENNPEAEGQAPVNHFFAPGVYSREMLIPIDTVIVGKIHKHAHINIISKGIIDVATELGTVRYVAPITFVSDALTKRCVYAITDTIWTTVHATDKTDINEIEDEIIAKSYDLIEGEEL
jgi:hypothetical protein